MLHHTPLIATIVAGLVGAFILGALAQRLKVSPLVGYLMAGVLVGPFTPGYVADQGMANELAEIGVILLMFGVGLHFSLKDLLSVKAIAIPGALAQIAIATLLGMGLAHWLGWPPAGGVVFGLSLSVASTVVLLRALQERHILRTDRGRIAVGWLIVEDLATVLALVLLPALAGTLNAAGGGGPADWLGPLGITLAKVAGFIAFMLIVGRRVIPWLLHYVAHTGSRELFRLAVLAIALGVAFGAALLFQVSFALGAFFAGMILAESELSQRAAEETLPLRDAFAVLFFVSVGMLFNPMVLVEQPWPLVATLAIILVGKSIVAYAIVRAFRHTRDTALTIAASLAQIGEFSFILAALGVELGLLPTAGRDLILAGAIISIMLNPVVFSLVGRATRPPKLAPLPPEVAPPPSNDLFPTNLTEHVVIVGFGRVGEVVADGLEVGSWPFLVIEPDEAACARARDKGYETMCANGVDPTVLHAARVAEARRLLVAVPDGFEAGQIIEQARRLNPDIDIVARAHSDAEVGHLLRLGADETIMGEREIALAMLDHVRRLSHVGADEEEATGPLILDDVEYGVLGALRGYRSGEPAAPERVYEKARRNGAYTTQRLEEAIRSLKAKGCLVDAPYGRVAPTPRGLAAAVRAP